MKKIRKENVSYYDVFVACDGTEFRDEKECRIYDESAKGVLNAKYKKLVVCYKTEYDLFNVGSDEANVDIVRIKSQADADVVLQMFFMENPHLLTDNNENYAEMRTRAEDCVRKALKDNDALFVGKSYDDGCFWLIGTLNSIKEKLDKLCAESQSNA